MSQYHYAYTTHHDISEVDTSAGTNEDNGSILIHMLPEASDDGEERDKVPLQEVDLIIEKVKLYTGMRE
jgi:hypothetical protein